MINKMCNFELFVDEVDSGFPVVFRCCNLSAAPS